MAWPNNIFWISLVLWWRNYWRKGNVKIFQLYLPVIIKNLYNSSFLKAFGNWSFGQFVYTVVVIVSNLKVSPSIWLFNYLIPSTSILPSFPSSLPSSFLPSFPLPPSLSLTPSILPSPFLHPSHVLRSRLHAIHNSFLHNNPLFFFVACSYFLLLDCLNSFIYMGFNYCIHILWSYRFL